MKTITVDSLSLSKGCLVHVALITLVFALSIEIVPAQPPVLLSATVAQDGSVAAAFNEPLDEVSANDTFNYIITGSDGIVNPVLLATLAADQQTVTLVPFFAFTPGVSYTLLVFFVCDVTGDCVEQVSAPITFPQLPPVANSQSVDVVVNTPAGITLTGSDANGDPLTFLLASPPTHGALLGDLPNVTYSPLPGYIGPDSFTFKVNDGITDSAPATVLIEVKPPAVTFVPAGSIWKYLDTGVDPGPAWKDPFYNDSSWAAGPAELGFGDGDEATVITNRSAAAPLITAYFRHSFTVANPSTIASLSLQVWRDDGVVVYLNGVEVLRDNMPGGSIVYSNLARMTAADDGNVPLTNQLSPSLLVNGDNLLAVEVHQANLFSSPRDLSFDLQLDAILLLNPPDIVSAAACGPVVTVTFDEALEPSSATDPFNYNILGPVGTSLFVLAAILEPDQLTVTLFTELFTPGVSYTLEAFNICDTSGDCLSQGSVPIQFDFTPPTVTCNVATNMLFPPNEVLTDVGLTATASEGILQLRVFSDEPALAGTTDATFDGNVLRLRAHRHEDGNGRVYLIVVTAFDPCGNIGTCCKTVVVPHNLSKAARDSANAQAAAAAAQCAPQGAPSTPFQILP